MDRKITEGYMPFLGHETYYRIVGEASDKAPLLLLHVGAGIRIWTGIRSCGRSRRGLMS